MWPCICGLTRIYFPIRGCCSCVRSLLHPPYIQLPTILNLHLGSPAAVTPLVASYLSFDAALSTAVTMDGDPAVEPELDSFSLTLPLPYRVALVVVLGTVSSCSREIIADTGQAFGHGARICIICLLLKL